MNVPSQSRWAVAIGSLLLAPNMALAGMPSLRLSDAASLRLQSISFFLLCLGLSAVFVRSLWNAFAREFPRWPRLSLLRSTGLVTLWGLLFVIVLTMVSGARELLTPGAWKKQGLTYTLADTAPKPNSPEATERLVERYRQIDRLHQALVRFADEHAGRFPAEDEVASLPDAAWRLPEPLQMRYVYIGQGLPKTTDAIVAHEPDVYEEPLALYASGKVRPFAKR